MITAVWNEWHDDEGRRARKPVTLETDTEGQAAYIAAWHPSVAIAVADWLTATADYAERRGLHLQTSVGAAALAVATAYLGESS